MLAIHALPAFADNYIWLLQNDRTQSCAVVDPGDAAPVLSWLAGHPGYQLRDILVTHHHQDHTGGILTLKAQQPARVIGPANEAIPGRDLAVTDGDLLDVLGVPLRVMAVPGHTLGHVAYVGEIGQQNCLFSGDTLFAGGCGRLFEGTPAQMQASLTKLAALPPQTQVYCAHEYTLSNLGFAAAVEPDNLDIQERLKAVALWRQHGRISLPSNLAIELKTNPFLRAGNAQLRQRLATLNEVPLPDALACFTWLRAWKDRF